MEQIISKEELAKIKNIKGEIRGTVVKIIGEYVLLKEGENGLNKLDDLMRSLDCSTEYRKINKVIFLPTWLVVVSFLATKRLFNFTNEDFQKMGEMDVKISPFLKIFIKYFVSLKKLEEAVPKMWNNFLPDVKVELTEFNEKEKYSIMKLDNFDLSENCCQYFIGFANTLTRMIGRENFVCEETKCTFRGDDHHEFKLKW